MNNIGTNVLCSQESPYEYRGPDYPALAGAYQQVRNSLERWLYIDDQEAINIVLAGSVALYLPGDPLWLRIIKPSGGGGTEILRAIRHHPDSFPLDRLTGKTLDTGYKGGESLLPKLNNKRVITPDLSTVLGNKLEQSEVFSQFRRAFDGEMVSYWGSEKVGGEPITVKFDWLCATTVGIEKSRIAQQELGERFIDVRWSPERGPIAERAALEAGNEVQMRQELARDVELFINACKSIDCMQPPPQFRLAVARLADKTALLRQPVIRDKYKTVLYIPDPERGTRLAKEMLKLAQGLSLFTEPYRHLVRVAKDCIPSIRAKVLYALLHEKHTATEIGQFINLPKSTVEYELENLQILGVCEREHKTGGLSLPSDSWKLKDRLGDIESELAQANIVEIGDTRYLSDWSTGELFSPSQKL